MSRRTLPLRALLFLLLLLFPITVAGILSAPEEAPTAEKASEESPQTEPPAKPRPLVIPDAEKKKKNPVAATPESIDSGRNLFSTQCAMCHGRRGDGKGELVSRLKIKVPDLTDATAQQKRTDGEYFYIVRHGCKDMPSESRLESDEIWHMVNYMRTLPRKGGGS